MSEGAEEGREERLMARFSRFSDLKETVNNFEIWFNPLTQNCIVKCSERGIFFYLFFHTGISVLQGQEFQVLVA